MSSTYLTLAASTPTSAQKGTMSCWVKRSTLGSTQYLMAWDENSTSYSRLYFNSSDKLAFKSLDGGSNYGELITNRLFRDTSAWYHIVCAIDTTLGTSGDRIKFYVNGVRETSFDTESQPSVNRNLKIGEAAVYIGMAAGAGFSGSMSHINYVDGTQYQASDFGSTDSTTGEWKINTSPSVTYGLNGFFILKDGNSVTDQSGQGNNFTVGGGTLTKTEDCPSNVFATLNPLGHASANFTLIEGNLYSGGADNNWRSIFGTIGSSSGKYYYEMKVIGHNNEHVGIASADQIASCSDSSGKFTDNSFGAEGYSYTSGGQKANNGSEVSWGNSYTTNDIIGVAFDLDNSKLYFSKNGTWQESGDPTSGSTGTGAAYTLVANKIYLPAMASYNAASNMAFNFGNGFFRTTAISSAGTNASGNGIFEYDVPTGYTAVSTKGFNL